MFELISDCRESIQPHNVSITKAEPKLNTARNDREAYKYMRKEILSKDHERKNGDDKIYTHALHVCI